MNYYSQEDIQRLEDIACNVRQDIISMIHTANAGHPGGSLSAADILTALYFHVMNIRPEDPKWPGRDRFVLSKGHGCPALYAVLANRGLLDKKHLATLRRHDSLLQGHPDMRKTPHVDMTSGSLGNGFAASVGMAMHARFRHESYRVYALLGDGECQEGVVWEAAMTASHYHLSNLVAIIDYNGLQINGYVNKVMSIEPLADKFKAFGWQVIEADGHDFKSLLNAFFRAQKYTEPVCIIAHTVKGKGVSFMENNASWHGKAPNDSQAEQALRELAYDHDTTAKEIQ